ncbi:MAG TPA: hypothetical protein PLD15_06225 [Mesotoga sp.]|nr:hypothetical protein [Mesotoga sp.]
MSHENHERLVESVESDVERLEAGSPLLDGLIDSVGGDVDLGKRRGVTEGLRRDVHHETIGLELLGARCVVSCVENARQDRLRFIDRTFAKRGTSVEQLSELSDVTSGSNAEVKTGEFVGEGEIPEKTFRYPNLVGCD